MGESNVLAFIGTHRAAWNSHLLRIMIPGLEAKADILQRPGINFLITACAIIGFGASAEAISINDTFIFFFGMACIEETSKFLFAMYLRRSTPEWEEHSISFRIFWLSVWGLCEIFLKATGFAAKIINSEIPATAGIMLAAGLGILPSATFHALCIRFYRKYGDLKLVVPFTILHTSLNYCIVHLTPDGAPTEIIIFFYILLAAHTLLLILTAFAIRPSR